MVGDVCGRADWTHLHHLARHMQIVLRHTLDNARADKEFYFLKVSCRLLCVLWNDQYMNIGNKIQLFRIYIPK